MEMSFSTMVNGRIVTLGAEKVEAIVARAVADLDELINKQLKQSRSTGEPFVVPDLLGMGEEALAARVGHLSGSKFAHNAGKHEVASTAGSNWCIVLK